MRPTEEFGVGVELRKKHPCFQIYGAMSAIEQTAGVNPLNVPAISAIRELNGHPKGQLQQATDADEVPASGAISDGRESRGRSDCRWNRCGERDHSNDAEG
ncbi:hypothetical protein CLE01_10580 [Cryobacterium levicorallinum]|nr:hypothetical protein CLE01_10580 [Cryobacterium levicorallinum]